jgi:hypothetical protein
MKLEFSGEIKKKKTLNINYHQIHIVGAKLFHADGQMDRHDESNSCFLQFSEHA